MQVPEHPSAPASGHKTLLLQGTVYIVHEEKVCVSQLLRTGALHAGQEGSSGQPELAVRIGSYGSAGVGENYRIMTNKVIQFAKKSRYFFLFGSCLFSSSLCDSVLSTRLCILAGITDRINEIKKKTHTYQERET